MLGLCVRDLILAYLAFRVVRVTALSLRELIEAFVLLAYPTVEFIDLIRRALFAGSNANFLSRLVIELAATNRRA